MTAPKTKEFVAIVDNFSWNNGLLLVTGNANGQDDAVYKSAQNLDNVTILPVEGLNVYDILKRPNLAMTKDAVELVLERLG